jgi:Tfp pilus assembly PilM family ATPase
MDTAFFSPHNRFFALFPPPSLLAAPFAAVWFSSGSLSLIEFAVGSQGPYFSRLIKKDLAPGVLGGGTVVDEAGLALALRELQRESGLRRVRLVLPDEKVYLFTVGVPMLSPKETRDNISFQIEENVPLTLEECVFDYSVIPEGSIHGIRASRRAAVVVLEKAILESYLRAATAAGFQILSVEAESQALARAVVPFDTEESRLLVHIGKNGTGIHIVARGVVHYASSVDIGEVSFDAALKKSFPEATPQDITEMKRAHSFTGAPKEKEFVSALVGSVSALQDEVSRRYLYWHSREEVEAAAHPPIASVTLSGAPAVLKGLAEHLSEGLRIPVTIADPWINAPLRKKGVPPIPLPEALGRAAAIGGALRGLTHSLYA